MKKLFFVGVLFFGTAAYSQAQFVVGAHIGPAFPMGEFSDFANLGFGLGGEVKYMLSENVAFGFDIGWYSFGTAFENVDSNITPFLFSAEYLIPQTSGFTPYVGLGLGPYRVADRTEAFGFRTTTSTTEFGIAPTLGALYPLNDQMDINVNLKFNFVFVEDETYIFIPLNAGILLKIP